MLKWCPKCRSIIPPPVNSLSDISLYSQHNKCYRCFTPLQILPSQTPNVAQEIPTAKTMAPKDNSQQIQRLKFEHERKQSEIRQLQTKISQLQIELNRESDAWEYEYNRAASRGPSGIQHFDASGFQNMTRILHEQIDDLSSQIQTIEREMEEIERKLDTLW